jgi:parvulin-like peptidyl-prolyl isomerase
MPADLDTEHAMKRNLSVLLALSLTLAACMEASQSPEASGEVPAEEGSADEDALEALRRNVAETAAREELDVEQVRVAHILVAFAGADRATVTRSKEEAELLAAELLARIEAGEDFMELMKASSDDPGPCVYGMTTGTPGGDFYPRNGMAPAFGHTGYRLEVGQTGVAAYHPEDSPFGWHIITRVE